MSDALQGQAAHAIVAKADIQYRWRVYVFFILVFGYGLWSLRDGFIIWPRENAQWQAMIARGERPPQSPHNDAGLLINQVLGIVLPAVSLPAFAWLMYRSRGAYRLADDMLYVPGHPPVPLEAIQSLDKSLWERKGIAIAEYELVGGRKGTITLRDMVYSRRETDMIVRRVEEHLDPAAAPPQTPAST